MGGFPALPSPNNPYIGAAADYASGAARLATSLREAANQQQLMKQQAADKAATQKRQDASDLAGALREGAVPLPGALPQPGAAPPSGGLPPLGTRPTLKRPDDPPSSGSPFSAPDDQGQTTAQAQPAGRSPGLGAQASAETSDYSFDPQRIVNRGGTPVYYPTAEEKAAVEAKSKKANETQDDTNSFVLSPTAATAMNEAGYANVKAGDRIPMAHAATVTEAVKAHLTKSALDDTNSVQITQSMVDKLAPHGITLKPGARVSLEKAGELKSLLEMAEPKEPKEPGEKALHWERNENDAGDVVLRGLDPITGKEVQKFQYPGEGHRKKDPDAAPTPKPPSPSQFRIIEQNKAKALATAQKQYNEDKSTAFTDDLSKAAEDNFQKARGAAQNAYEAEISAATGQDVPHNAWADTPAPATRAAPAKPAGPGRAPGKYSQPTGNKQPVTVQHIRSYAAQKYPGDPKGEAKAIREFQAYGYPIGQ